MTKSKETPVQANGQLRRKSASQISEILGHIPEMTKYLGSDRAMLLAIAAIFVFGMIARAGTFELLIAEGLILTSWAMGKVFKWF